MYTYVYKLYNYINIQCTVVFFASNPLNGSRPIAPHQSRTGTEGRGVLFGRHQSHQGPARAAALVDVPGFGTTAGRGDLGMLVYNSNNYGL